VYSHVRCDDIRSCIFSSSGSQRKYLQITAVLSWRGANWIRIVRFTCVWTQLRLGADFRSACPSYTMFQA